MPLYTSATLRQIESHFSHLPLMQRAGAAAAAWAGELASQRDLPILILAGPGNNGGDAFEAARLLRQRFFQVCVVFAGDPTRLPADAAAAYQRFSAEGGTTSTSIPVAVRWSLIIDGLFGIGLTRRPDGHYADWINQANQLSEQNACPLLALDCPSGLNADTGTVFDPAIQASQTLTFIANKPGLLTADGPDHCGEVRIASLDLALSDFPPEGLQLSRADFATHLQPRAQNTHKGSFGNAGVLGGSPSMVGAALLSARAALKLGAGRVYLGLLDPAAPTVDPQQPELMLRSPEALLATDLNALACGPGLGQSAAARQLLEQAIKSPHALVLDADALNLLAQDSHLKRDLQHRHGPVTLTPHPAEAARLLGCSVPAVQADRIKAARQLARDFNAHVALKGCGTVICAADGRYWINRTGNPGMATAGMGDVLTGISTALLAQGWSAECALLGAVYIHGMAADDLVDQGIGPIGLTAGEVIDAARLCLNRFSTK